MSKKVFSLAIRLYSLLYFVSVIFSFVFLTYMNHGEWKIALFMAPVAALIYGIVGVQPTLGGSATLFIFPFLPIILTSIFLIFVSRSIMGNMNLYEKINGLFSWKKIIIGYVIFFLLYILLNIF